MEETQNDILSDIITDSKLIQATGWKRFANLLIDYAGFIVLIYLLIFICLFINSKLAQAIDQARGDGEVLLLLSTRLFYTLYISASEIIFKSQSLGKLITGTKAVNENGSNITVRTAFKKRSEPHCTF